MVHDGQHDVVQRTDQSTHDEVSGRCGFILRHFYRRGPWRGKPPHRESPTLARSERLLPRSEGDGSAAGVQGWGAARAAAARGIGEEIAWGDQERLHVKEQGQGGFRGARTDRAKCATAVPPQRCDRGSGPRRLARGDYER